MLTDMNGHTFTDLERLQRIVDREQIEQIVGKRVYFVANEERAKEIDELWVKLPENQKSASFGQTWGFYKGLDHIKAWYVDEHEEKLKKLLHEYSEVLPEIKEDVANRGFGQFSAGPYIAPAVQIAGDGKTAKGIWYTIGVRAEGHPDGSINANWLSSKVAFDFIREPEGWKIWHVVEVYDSYFPMGTNHGDSKDIYEPGEDPLEIEFGTPDIKELTHQRILCWTDDFPWMPEPYYTMTDELSYGPEGWPHVKMEVFPE